MKSTRKPFNQQSPEERHAADIAEPCPDMNCLAPAGQECRELPFGIVHIGRRLKRLILEKCPEWLDKPS